MLEDLAFSYINQSDSHWNLTHFGLSILGAIAAGITNRSNAELSRAPYFVYLALIAIFLTAAQIVLLQWLSAMKGGYLWALVAVHLSATIASGFFLAKVAIARSYDARGNGSLAPLAFIPFANLWLLFKRSKSSVPTNRAPTIRLMTGGLGVLFGFGLLIVAGSIGIFVVREADRIAERTENDPLAQQASVGFMIRSHGLDETLRQLAADITLPIRVDEVTTLTRIDSRGTQLRRTYVVVGEISEISEEIAADVADGICTYSPFIPLLRAGATFREVFIKADGAKIGAVQVDAPTCGL